MNGRNRWNRKLHGEMRESVIRLLHGAPERARVSTYSYDAGDEIEGLSQPTTVYLISGSLELESEGNTVRLVPGDALDFHGGEYVLRISEATPTVAIWAWEFPDGFVPD